MAQLRILYLVTTLMDLSVAAATFAVGRRAAELGATAFELGLLGSVWLGVYSVCAPLAGRLSDRAGRRMMAIVGTAIAAVSTLACAFTTNIPFLLVLTGVMGMGVGMYWPPIIVWVGGGLTGRPLAARMARFSVAWNVGMLIGYGISGKVFQFDPRLSFVLAAGGMGVIVLLLSLQRGEATTTAPTETAMVELRHVPKGRGFRKTAWLSNFSMLFAVAGMLALFPQLATRTGIAPDLHGYLLLLHRLAALGVVLVLPHFQFWQTRLWPLWIVQAIAVLGVAAIGVGESTAWFCAALMVCGAMLGYNYQASILFTFEEMTEKGKGSGIHEAMLGLGAFFGPILAGWVGNHFNSSMRTPYFFCAAVLAAFIVIEMGLVVWRRGQLGGSSGTPS